MINLVSIFFTFHVYEVYNNDHTDTAKFYLVGDFARRFEIIAQDCLLLISFADKSTGVDIDDGHGFGMVDNNIPPGFQPHLSAQGTCDFLLYTEIVEETFLFVIKMDTGSLFRRKALHEISDRFVLVAGVDQQPINLSPEKISNDTKTQAQIAVQ